MSELKRGEVIIGRGFESKEKEFPLMKKYASRYAVYNGHSKRYRVTDHTGKKVYVVDEERIAWELYHEMLERACGSRGVSCYVINEGRD